MKKILLLLLICFTLFIVAAKAQSVAINTTGATANSAAILDVSSTAKGMLIPRMSSVQRTSIGTPANGLLVYDNDSLAFAYYNGVAWSFIKGNGNIAAGWGIKGNAGTTSANFIGTTDNQDIIFKRNGTKAGLLNSSNTAFGVNSFLTTTGDYNAAFGVEALISNTTGNYNVAVGIDALYKNTTGSHNTANGSGALSFNTIGSHNTANGSGALYFNSTGSHNTANGDSALYNNTTGSKNVAIGTNALYKNANSSNLVAIGDSALYNNNAGTRNTAIGSKALHANTIGLRNTANGFEALYANTDGSHNTANGNAALFTNTTGSANTATGAEALYDNTTGTTNTANGYAALANNTTGNSNTANGYAALLNNTTGSFNTANGTDALRFNTTGYSNVAIGTAALYKNTIGSNLVAIGDSALYNNGTGATLPQHGRGNTAIGSKALFANTTGLLNTAIGFSSLNQNTTGSNNSAIGSLSLFTNTTGSKNIAIGTQPLYNTTTGSGNIGLGYVALFDNTTGNNNVALGENALYNNETGNANIAIGFEALSPNTAGTNNIAIGKNAGTSILNYNGFYNTYIGDSTMMLADRTNSTVIGSKAYTTTNNSMVLGSINGVNGATADVKVGIGVTDPAEKLEIGKGRLRFRGNLIGGNAHGITWTNNAGTTDRAFTGMETDDFWGIYNFGLSNWNVRVHNTSGEVGIFKQPLTTIDDSRLQVKQRGSQNGIGIENSNTTNHWDMYLESGAAPNFNFYYNGIQKSYIRNSDGAYIQVSDKNLKKDITPLQSSLQKINSLLPYQYRYLQNTSADNYSIGFMAQDVQKIFPDAVSESVTKDDKTQLGVNYQYFTVLAIKGLQEQQENMNSQNKKIEVLENQVAELKKLVEASLKK